ncbi:MAG: hypothetical protein GF350_08440 [Chitinivibrionales bacterium]|nr:hypothetical protein [Chitinivibrionales bacterium]
MRSEPMIYCPVLKKVVPISQRKSEPPPLRQPASNTIQIITDSLEPMEMIGLPAHKISDDKVVDTIVDSKSQRRRLLKEHGMIEIGNETPPVVERRRAERIENNEPK